MDDAAMRRARIRRCQEEHLEAATTDTCNVLDCPFYAGECSEVATDLLLAQKGDQWLMRELADDPTLGRNPQKITSLIDLERDWFRIAQAIPEMRSMAFSHMRGFSLIVRREEVIHLAIEAGTSESYFGLLKMLRVTGLEVPVELQAELKEHLVRDGFSLDGWEDVLGMAEPDEYVLAPAMVAARDCAKLEAATHHADWNQMEYWLLGILQVVLGRVLLPGRYGFDEAEKRAYEQDVEDVRNMLAQRGLGPRVFEQALNKELTSSPGTGRSAWRWCCEEAERQAQSRGVQGVWAADVMMFCLRLQSAPVQAAIGRCLLRRS